MSTKTALRVNITLDESLKEILDIMQQSYPTLSYSDLIRMATGGYFASKKAEFLTTNASVATTTKKYTKKEIQEWRDSLPELKLSKVKIAELEANIEESLKSGTVGPFDSVEEALKYLNKNTP